MLGRLKLTGGKPAGSVRWSILALALVVALLALSGVGFLVRDQLQDRGAAGEAAIGGPFRLTNQYGERVTPQNFAGQYMLVYFGYTFCPDVCPLTLTHMTDALDRLPDDVAERIVPVFITVDPARDTVEQLAEYAPAFHPRLVALTGTDAEVKAATRAYRVYSNKVEDDGRGNYLMDHSSFIYLMGPDGRYVDHFSSAATPEQMAKRLGEIAGTS